MYNVSWEVTALDITKTIELFIDETTSEKTIKTLLRNHIGISAAILAKLKKYPDGILVNGVHQNVNYILKNGDKLCINIRDNASQNIEPINIPIDILFEDDEIIAVNKPRNMPTHPSQNHHGDTLANGVMYYYKNTSFTFRPITRLDRDTSGVVLIAKNQLSASVLSEQMLNFKIQKQYIAVCHGVFENKSGVIDAPIARLDGSGILREVSESGKTAVTDYEVISEKNHLTLVKLFPKTGRTHQLRVHLSHIGHPIYGDDLYGSPVKDKKTLLHCEKICFIHPKTNENTEIVAKIPEDITEIIIIDKT